MTGRIPMKPGFGSWYDYAAKVEKIIRNPGILLEKKWNFPGFLQ